MHPTFRLLQRHAAVLFVLAAIPVLLLILTGTFPEPALPAAWAIAQGVGIVWIGSGAWEGREKWAVRLQVTFVGVAVATLIASQQNPNVSGVGLLLFMVAVLLMHFAHIVSQTLYVIQQQLVTVRGFARTEAARHALFFLTFAGPAALAISPNVIGVAFLAVTTALVANVTGRRATRLLRAGLTREAEDA